MSMKEKEKVSPKDERLIGFKETGKVVVAENEGNR